jgi:hypothetical protein
MLKKWLWDPHRAKLQPTLLEIDLLINTATQNSALLTKIGKLTKKTFQELRFLLKVLAIKNHWKIWLWTFNLKMIIIIIMIIMRNKTWQIKKEKIQSTLMKKVAI